MASGRQSESLKHLLMVVLGKDESNMPYQLIVGKFKCRSLTDLAKIKPEKFQEQIAFIDSSGQVTQEELAEAEIMELCDLQELVKAHKYDIQNDWSLITKDEFNQFHDDLLEDANLVKAQQAAQAAAAVQAVQAVAVQAAVAQAAAAQAAAAAQTAAATTMVHGNVQPNASSGATNMLTA
jgi:hypothetical protein